MPHDRRADDDERGRQPPASAASRRPGSDTPPALKLPEDRGSGPAEGKTPRFFERFAWFVAIWAMSVAALLAVSAILRVWLVP